jgi:cytochrome bd-type quinol oxidase subunit 2
MTCLASAGVGATIWPYALPYRLSIVDAAADPASLLFVLVGIILVLPIVVWYQLYAYRVFAGKVREDISTYGAPAASLTIQARRVHDRSPALHLS